MAATLLHGKPVSEAVISELRQVVQALDRTPRLEMIRVGDDPASVIYGEAKAKAANRVGIRSQLRALPADVGQDQLADLVKDLNGDADVDGILLQLPVPAHLEAEAVLELIDPDKDVDGLSTRSAGRLWTGQTALTPCTPAGLLRMLDYYRLPVEGRFTVIVGRSNLVGKPAAALFLRRHATVALAHSRTRDLGGLSRQADIIVAAAGQPGLVGKDMVGPGAVVLDVGLTRVAGKIRGDVDPEVAQVAGYLTPMPGGTGVMTVAMLMHNTVEAARRRAGG